VAGDNGFLINLDNVLEPTGSPVSTYASTRDLKISKDLLLSSAILDGIIDALKIIKHLLLII
jgi:hypothetical protein